MVSEICSIPECGTAGKITRGWCIKHYNRWLKHGSTDDPRKTPQQRFWAKVQKTESCWLWTAYRDEEIGYGQASIDGRPQWAHRVAYRWANGPIPHGMEIDHVCHVRHCVNPEHLRLATKKQNAENRVGAQGNSKSRVLGVSWFKSRNKWVARVTHNGKPHHVGYFDDLEEAEAAVIAKRKELFTHNDFDRIAA